MNHQDGTIGQITVVRATNDAFAESAIAAVKQWRTTMKMMKENDLRATGRSPVGRMD